MQVRMKTVYAGPAGHHDAGAVANFEPKEARKLIEGGFADPIEEPVRRRSKVDVPGLEEAGEKDSAGDKS